jgi:hypothetical protein
VVAADGTVTALSSGSVNLSGVTAPAGGGTLVLAEPYGGWTAMLNGHTLKPVATPVNGWAQGFVLPAGGGHLSITRNDMARMLSLFLELVATLAICLLALPGKRADPVEEAEALTALREARSDKSAASSVRRATRSVRTVGHRAAGRIDRFAFARKRPGQPQPEPEPAKQASVGQGPADGEQAAAAARDGESAAPAHLDEAATAIGPVAWSRGSFVGRSEKTSTGDSPSPPWDMAGEWGSGSRTGPSRAWTDHPLETAKSPEGSGSRVGAEQPDDPVRLPGQRASTSVSPVSGTPVPEDEPPWETRARRAPWDSDSRGPAARPVSRTGPQPAPGTGPQSIAWTGPQPGTRADAESASRTGPEPVSGTGRRLSSWTGPQPTSGAGAGPAAPDGAQPASRSGAQPVSRTGAQPAPGTGPHRIFWTKPRPAASTGGQPVARTEAQPPAPAATQPASMAPWDSVDWAKAPGWDAMTRDRERDPARDRDRDRDRDTSAATVEPKPEPVPTPEPARGSGAPPAGGRPAKPERHSHRAAKHGKPSRWRGSGNRSTRGGES